MGVLHVLKIPSMSIYMASCEMLLASGERYEFKVSRGTLFDVPVAILSQCVGLNLSLSWRDMLRDIFDPFLQTQRRGKENERDEKDRARDRDRQKKTQRTESKSITFSYFITSQPTEIR